MQSLISDMVEPDTSKPSWVGSRQVRYHALSPDNAQLTLMLKDTTGRVTQSLVWKRSRQ